MALPESLVKNMTKFQVSASPIIYTLIQNKIHIHFEFQAKNDIPIFLKGGPPDKILFGITAVGCGLGLLSIVHLVYQMGFAKKGK